VDINIIKKDLEGIRALFRPVSEVYSKELIYVKFPDAELEDLIRLMVEKNVHRIYVVYDEEEMQPSSVLTSTDIIKEVMSRDVPIN
jgi:CBS domain-containing protein